MSAAMAMTVTDTVRLFLFPILMAFAAFSDLFTMTISNRLSVLLIAGFFATALLIGMGGHEMVSHLGAGAAVLCVTFTLFACGWIGGGDAKLAAATALWLGFGPLPSYLIYASLFGGALTLALLQYRIMPLPALLAGQDWAVRLHRADVGVPYGIALAAAALAVYPHTVWMKSLTIG
jgi:prepilin peptidase CpaA